jgi:hypothetical protein
VTATAEIIDLATYRKAKQRAPQQEPGFVAVPPMFVGWMPVWVMVPVPVVPAIGSA